MKTPKIAIQMAANPRSFRRNFEFFQKNLREPLNADLFIHTWNLHGRERPDVTTDGSCEEYISLYKPTASQIDDLHYDYQPLMTMVPHFTSRQRCNDIRKKFQREAGIEYDVVIMARPDVRLTDPIPHNNSKVRGQIFEPEYARMVGENQIWVHHFKEGIPADYFFYCSPKWMDITIDGCMENLDKLNIYYPGSERLWWFVLQQNGFKRDDFKYYGNSIHDQDHIDNSLRLFDIACIR